MAKKEWTPEEREAYSIAAKQRHADRRARLAAQAAAAPAPLAMPPIVHEDAVPAEDYSDEAINEENHRIGQEDLDDPFEKFLLAQDAETRAILSDVELRVIYESEAERAANERKAALKKATTMRAAP